MPSIEEQIREIQTVDLDMEFAEGEEKKRLEAAKMAKTWRTVRSAAKNRLTSLANMKSNIDVEGLLVKSEESGVTQGIVKEEADHAANRPEGTAGNSAHQPPHDEPGVEKRAEDESNAHSEAK